MMGALVIPAGCATPNWVRQIGQLPACYSDPPAAAATLIDPENQSETPTDLASAAAETAADSEIILSSWDGQESKLATTSLIAAWAVGAAADADRSQPTLAALVVQNQTDSGPEFLPHGLDAAEFSPPAVMPHSDGVAQQPISLALALAITSGQNPQVNFARQRINEAFANLEAAEVLWLPSLRAGGNYNKHEGRIQDVAGEIIETSRGSVYTGLGAQAVGAGSPAVPGLLVDFHVRDALFQPQIASQVLGARRQESRAVTNDLMLETAVACIDLLEAMQIQAIAQQMLAEAETLANTTLAFAESGQGLQADADRSRAEV